MQEIKTLSGWRHVAEKGTYDKRPEDRAQKYDQRKTDTDVSIDSNHVSALHRRHFRFNKAVAAFYPSDGRHQTEVLLEDGSYLCQVTVERDCKQLLDCHEYNYTMLNANITALTKTGTEHTTVESKGTVHVSYKVSAKDPINWGFLYREDPTYMTLTFDVHDHPVHGISQEFLMNKQSVFAYEASDQRCQDITFLTAHPEDKANKSTRYDIDYYTRR